MRELSIDRLNYRVILAANCDRAHQVFGFQWLDGRERARPTFLPIREHVVSRRARQHFKFHVAIEFRLLAVGGQKVGPARDHVPGHVLHVDGDAVRFFIERLEEIFVADLGEGAFSEFLVIAKSFDRVVEIMLGGIVHDFVGADLRVRPNVFR